MNEVLTWKQIVKKHPDAWVLIGDPETNEVQEVLKGTLLYHHKNRESFWRKVEKLELKPNHIAILFTGKRRLKKGMGFLL